jgi:hypothetical protein
MVDVAYFQEANPNYAKASINESEKIVRQVIARLFLGIKMILKSHLTQSRPIE